MREISIGIAHYLVLNFYAIQQHALLLFLAIVTHLTASHWVNWHILVVHAIPFIC